MSNPLAELPTDQETDLVGNENAMHLIAGDICFRPARYRLGLSSRFSILTPPLWWLFGLIAFAAQPAHAQDIDPGMSPGMKPATTRQAAPQEQIERFDDWMLRCVSQAADSERNTHRCEVAQTVRVQQNGQALDVLKLAVSRASDKAGKASRALVVLTPLDVDLAGDFGFAAGTAKPSLLRYRNCNHAGCFVIIPLDSSLINQMKQASNGAAFFRLLNGQTVKVSFSLKGFTKAFEALSAGTVPATGQTTGETPGVTPADAGKEGANN